MVYMIVLISVSDFTELAIVNISIEHNMHADLSILAHRMVSIVSQISASSMHIYIGKGIRH